VAYSIKQSIKIDIYIIILNLEGKYSIVTRFLLSNILYNIFSVLAMYN